MSEGTVDVARRHFLRLIHLEQRLHIFFELDVQRCFLQHPLLLHWTSRTYSSIHIPATILFLVVLSLLHDNTNPRLASFVPRTEP